jgi:cell division protein FtsQ
MDGGGRFLRSLNAGHAGAARACLPAQHRNPTFLDRLRVRSSLPRRALRRPSVAVRRRLPRLTGTALTLAFFAAVGITGAVLGGHVETLHARYGEPSHLFGRAIGLAIDRVTISGAPHLSEAEILAAAGISSKVSLAFLDAAEVRRRLESMPLIKAATVRKLYPDELILTLVAREPHALWQRDGDLFVIAADGVPLGPMQDGRFASLPLVVGDEANLRTKDYLALLEAAGPLRPRITAGTLISGRRWTLKIDNGIDVRLPERGAAESVRRLVALEREGNILGKDVIAIDLRIPDRVVVRLTEQSMAARLEALKKKPVRGRGLDT